MKNFLLTSLIFSLLTFKIVTQAEAQKIALNFDGSDDYVQTTFPGISGSAARTVEAMIRTTANADPNNGGKQKTIFDWGSTATGGRFTFNILFNNAIRIEVGGSGLSGKIAVNDGKWHHVAAVFNPADSLKYSLYVDGKLDVKGNITTTINTTTTVSGLIGMRVDNVNLFEGDIDEVRVFNFARPDSLINLDLNKSYCQLPSGLVAYYKLDEGNANSNNSTKKIAIDYSGNGYNGTLTNFNLYGSSSNWVTGPSLLGGNTSVTIDEFACDSYKSPSGKYTWTFPGTFRDTLPNFNQCDSLITIKLTIGRSNVTKQFNSCDSFVSPGNKTYYSSGIYLENYTSSKGCDSSIRYELTINHSVINNVQVSACDSFQSSGGLTYYSSGNYKEKYASFNNCDSIVVYDLTIHNSQFTQESIDECDSAYIDGNWYYSSQIVSLKLKAINQCDSVHEIALTINNGSQQKIEQIGCDSVRTSTGKLFTMSQIVSDSFKTISGCDSIYNYDISVYPSYQISVNQSNCDSGFVNGQWYFNSGKINFLLTSSQGCDSMVSVTLDLTKIDNGITANGNILTAKQTGAQYTWINCKDNQPISGANKQTFTATDSGSYAVIIEMDNCERTSDCYLVIPGSVQTISGINFIQLYPNPNLGHFEVNLSENLCANAYSIMDVTGRVILRNPLQGKSNFQINERFNSGIYYIVVETNKGSFIQNFRVE